MTQFSEPDAGFDRLLESPSSPEALGSAAFPRLEALLAAAAAVEAGPQPGEQVVLAAFRELVTEAAGTPSLESRRKAKHARQRMYALVAATSGVVLLSSGVAAAKTGALPGAAQSTAKSVLGVLGVHVPGPNAHAGNHPNQRGNSSGHSQTPSTTGSPDVTPPVHPTPPAQSGAQPSTVPTPGNSGVSRHHGNPTPTASGHPTPGHGKPTAAPIVSHRRTAMHPVHPTVPSTSVTHRSARSMSS